MRHIHFLNPKRIRFPFPIIFAAAVFLSGCGEHNHDDHSHDQNDHGHDHGSKTHDDHDDHGHGHGAAISVTQYTDRSELFMEYEPLIKDIPTQLIIHLTRLSDFTPITEGSLEVRLTSANGDTYSEIDNSPARDGIFLPTITVPFAKTARMELHLKSPQLEDVQVVEDVEVHYASNQVSHDEKTEEAEDPKVISFLKEQQWKIDYATEQVQSRPVYQAASAIATFALPAFGEAILPAPASGIVRFSRDTQIETGKEASEGTTLFFIEPDTSWQAGLAKLGEDYQLAKAELDRIKALQKQNAVSERRIEEAEIRLQTLRSALQQMGGEAALTDPSNLRGIAKAPFTGIISAIYIKPGQRVEAGEALALLSDLDRLILETHVVPSRLERLGRIVDATFRPTGSTRSYRVSELGGELVSQSPLSISGSNLANIRFQVENPDRRFIVGTKVSVQLLGGETSEDGVAVPLSAIQEEEGIPIVYVQTEGETVEKRYPKFGSSDGSYIQAYSGIEIGERVVTKGATFIRLASLSTSEMGHGHAH